MKQTLLVETNEAGKLHIWELIKEGKLKSVKMDPPIKTLQGYAIYFKRLNFTDQSVDEISFLKASLSIMKSKHKFEYLNGI
ncbi:MULTISPECIES: hypothetical protein [Acinetobacter calcoaceticus/baumannii complex]|uniref:hypothetical protein n=1 Tax=Acinetobacter calcoaceticus/baumannii complex TaxID=909768 RepID=UPI000445B865|nr:hypothetical protein [Acinetobacter sp. 1294243]EXR42299.1 hypothetical protein J655_1693 [Acinetobacter sp. 1294243]